MNELILWSKGVRFVGLVAIAGQLDRPVRELKHERVPPFTPPALCHLTALDDDVLTSNDGSWRAPPARRPRRRCQSSRSFCHPERRTCTVHAITARQPAWKRVVVHGWLRAVEVVAVDAERSTGAADASGRSPLVAVRSMEGLGRTTWLAQPDTHCGECTW